MPEPSAPMVSVCITSRHRQRELARCLASLREQEGAPPFEVLVSGNGDHDVEETVRGSFPDAFIVTIEQDHPGAARNVLLDHARGGLLLFLDDDIVADESLLATLWSLAEQHPKAGVFGGPNLSPMDSSDFEAVCGAVLSSIVGAGPVRRRYGEHPAGFADERYFILCNLAVRRSIMVPFHEDLACAEENQLLIDLAGAGVAMWYDPSLIVYHARRSTVRSFAAQMWKYGFGRGQVIARDLSALRPEFLAPTLFVIYLVTLPFSFLLHPASAVPLAAYAVAVVASAVKVAVTLRQPIAAPIAAWLTFILHVFYGLGIPTGMVKGPEVHPTRQTALAAVGPVRKEVGDG